MSNADYAQLVADGKAAQQAIDEPARKLLVGVVDEIEGEGVAFDVGSGLWLVVLRGWIRGSDPRPYVHLVRRAT